MTWLSNNFIVQRIVSNICRVTSVELALVLGLLLIYAAIENVSSYDNDCDLLPSGLRERILKDLLRVGDYDSVEEMGQIIERIPILVSSSSEDAGLSFVDLDPTSTCETTATSAVESFLQVTATN